MKLTFKRAVKAYQEAAAATNEVAEISEDRSHYSNGIWHLADQYGRLQGEVTDGGHVVWGTKLRTMYHFEGQKHRRDTVAGGRAK